MKNCKHESLMRPVNLFMSRVSWCGGERQRNAMGRKTRGAFYVHFNDLRELRDCSRGCET